MSQEMECDVILVNYVNDNYKEFSYCRLNLSQITNFEKDKSFKPFKLKILDLIDGLEKDGYFNAIQDRNVVEKNDNT